jgi:hypothetical protein
MKRARYYRFKSKDGRVFVKVATRKAIAISCLPVDFGDDYTVTSRPVTLSSEPMAKGACHA